MAEDAVGSEATVLHLGTTEVEEGAAVLILILVAEDGDTVVGQLLLPVGEGAGISPALCRSKPVEA